MKRSVLLALVCSAAFGAAPLLAAGVPPPPELQQLNVALGHWVFHGTSAATPTRPAQPFTWDSHCEWSPNHFYLECQFSNTYVRGKVESLVVNTYNTTDKTFWHYEFFAVGQSGKEPFVSRMDVKDNVWTEYGREAIPGKQTGERIIYTWRPPSHVDMKIEISKDGTHWTTVNHAEGVKQP
ncbi:MAG: hypothetical protein KGN76_16045 [Acidobacteriota bacterium]|nr:hypothetical protein [Acidobacteriota bacterium]